MGDSTPVEITTTAALSSTPEDALAKLERLRATLAGLRQQRATAAKEALTQAGDKADTDVEARALAIARQTTQQHIRLLTEYNEIKDVATNLIGMIADNRRQRIVDVMQDFDVTDRD